MKQEKDQKAGVNTMTIDDMFGAKVNYGAYPFIIETDEDAADLLDLITEASLAREITDEEEKKSAIRQLGIEDLKPNCIWSYVHGSEFYVNFAKDREQY